ncbi:MAG: VOC family protein [Pseudomonadota bacterium]
MTGPLLSFDHIAVRAPSLERGLNWVEAQLGITLPPGGSHPLMGTHNHLMALGPTTFFEVIAPDPGARAQGGRARWFDLDSFSQTDTPRLAVVCHSPDLEATRQAGAAADLDLGTPLKLTRGDLHWHFMVREDGSMPLDGILPLIMSWPASVPPTPHPAAGMPDLGWRLSALTLCHPDHDELTGKLELIGAPPMLAVAQDAHPCVDVVLTSPAGEQVSLRG